MSGSAGLKSTARPRAAASLTARLAPLCEQTAPSFTCNGTSIANCEVGDGPGLTAPPQSEKRFEHCARRLRVQTDLRGGL